MSDLPSSRTDLNNSADIGISAQDVTVTYRSGHTALWDASFDVPRGTVTALVGVNGAGQVDANQTGLTIGNVLYVDADGSLTTDSTNGIEAGAAITTTSILVSQP